jgi:putative peptidoglycan lipid II flippase
MDGRSSSIIKSIGLLTLLMIVSKILGLIREVAIAGFFGVSSSTDAYFVAAGFVTNIFFGITVALSTVFLPYYIQSKKSKTDKEMSTDLSALFSSLLVFSVFIIILLFFLAPIIVRLIAPSYIGLIFQETTLYLRIYSVSILFSLLTNMLTALFNAEKRYGFGAIASIVYSLTSIICMLLLKDLFGVTALVISIPISFFIQLVILLFNVRKHIKIQIKFRNLFNPTVKYIMVLMVPVLLSSTTIQINQLLTRSIATGLGEGAVSILSYSNTLFNFVTTLVMATFITVMFTEFSNLVKKDDINRFNQLLSKAVSTLIIVLVPIAAITFVFSKDIVSLAYGRGAFDENAVYLTATCLSIYAIAFVFDSIRNLLVKAFYSKNNMRTPLLNSIISFVITVGFSLIFSKYLGVNGIVLAIVLSIIVSAIFLIISAQKRICSFQIKKIFSTIWKTFVSAVVTIAILLILSYVTSDFSPLVRFVIAIGSGFSVYTLLLIILKCPEVLNFIVDIYHKMRPKKIS